MLPVQNSQTDKPEAPESSAATPNNKTVTPSVPAQVAASSVSAPLGLRNSDRRFVITLSSMIVLLTVVHLLRAAWTGTPAVEIRRLSGQDALFQIDVNHANWVEWMQLPTIGETTARTIVAHREAAGPFQSIDDLIQVKGIGKVTLEKIRPYLKIQETQPLEESAASAAGTF